MKTIYKYNLGTSSKHIMLPIGSKILTAQNQSDKIVLWALIDPNEQRQIQFSIMVILTGSLIEDEEDYILHYISTVQIHEIVYHIFEVME